MDGSRSRLRARVLLLSSFVVLLLVAACSSASKEQQILIDFFRAARLRDNTTLASISAVAFDPRTDGTVRQFDIAGMGPEQRRALQIGLAANRAAAVSSLTPPGRPDVDVSKMSVEVITKQVTVNAPVRTPEGRTVPRTLVFTLQRAVGREDGQTREGRWIITDLQRPSSGSKTS